jgi:superfamily II DNA/RNA helicase
MVATGISTRGLHIKDIKLIINYDLPTEIESYVNRIGRTGRIESKGSAISFFTPDDLIMVLKINNVLLEAGQDLPR